MHTVRKTRFIPLMAQRSEDARSRLRRAVVALVLLLSAAACTSRPADKTGLLLLLTSGLLAPSTGPAAPAGNPPEPGPTGSNMAQVQYDGFPAGEYPITACDVNNSSGSGIVIDTTSAAAIPKGTLLINPVPASSPFTFAADNPQLDLDGGGVHTPDGIVPCTLTRSSNTSTRYTATLSAGCSLNGLHTIQLLEIDCTPN